MKRVVRYALRTRSEYRGDAVDIAETPGFWANTWVTVSAKDFKAITGFLPRMRQTVQFTIIREVKR